MKTLITGITGQTGSILAEKLLNDGYEVHGIIRRSSVFNTERIDHIFDQLNLHFGDLSDTGSLRKIIFSIKPDYIFNMGAQSHVRVSFDIPEYTVDITGLGVLRILEAARELNEKKLVRFYQASSSEQFGSTPPPQNEETPFHPRSPYACAKVFAYHQVVNYREAYGLFASNGISFNHEGTKRGLTFVTRKITYAAARISLGLQKELSLGNLEAKRDWLDAEDVCNAIIKIINHHTPDDFVISSGNSYSVKDWLGIVFGKLNLDWEDYVKIDPKYFRPTEVNHLQGDSSKIKRVLNWEPKINIDQLAQKMLDYDLKLAQREYNVNGKKF